MHEAQISLLVYGNQVTYLSGRNLSSHITVISPAAFRCGHLLKKV